MNPNFTSVTNAINRLVGAVHKGTWDYISTIAVVVTLLVLIWYTWETHGLRRAAQRQNEISVMPILAVFIQSAVPNGSREIVFRHVGSGAAFNLSIDRVRFGNGELLIEHGSNVMTVGQITTLEFRFQEANRSTVLHLDGLYEWINTGRLPNPLQISVRCRALNSVDYVFRFAFTPDAGKLKVTFEDMEPVPV